VKYTNLEVLTVLNVNTMNFWGMTSRNLVDRQHCVILVGLENFVYPEDEPCSFVCVTGIQLQNYGVNFRSILTLLGSGHQKPA
jgi:hypothetical protein